LDRIEEKTAKLFLGNWLGVSEQRPQWMASQVRPVIEMSQGIAHVAGKHVRAHHRRRLQGDATTDLLPLESSTSGSWPLFGRKWPRLDAPTVAFDRLFTYHSAHRLEVFVAGHATARRGGLRPGSSTCPRRRRARYASGAGVTDVNATFATRHCYPRGVVDRGIGACRGLRTGCRSGGDASASPAGRADCGSNDRGCSDA